MRVLGLVALLLVIPSLLVAAQEPQTELDYAWPEHDDVTEALQDAADSSDWVTLHTVGASIDGNALMLVAVTDPGSQTPMADRVITLITTQQHGNEPAGTPAALQLLDNLVAGAGDSPKLYNQILLLWPQANPDGASAVTRGNGNGVDLNRDHVQLNEPEAIALHEVILQQWDVHVGMDHHEYSGTGPGYPVPARSYDWDATILYPRHGNVREPTQDGAVKLYDHLIEGLAEHDYTGGEYGVQTAAGIPVSHVAGGPDPGILRNNFGLNNVAGLLVETFVNPANPLVTPERRIDIHYQVMQDTLEFASDNAELLIAAKRSSELLNLEEPLSEYIEEWPVDPATEEPNADNIRAPMAVGYASAENIDAIMTSHGLPVGQSTRDGWAYATMGERQGLLGAILHPESTRVVADTIAMSEDSLPASAQPEQGAESQDTPATGILSLLAALSAALLVSRRRGDS
jgi:hypothetical protein